MVMRFLVTVAVLITACAHAPINTRLERSLDAAEVNRERPLPTRCTRDVVIVLSFSGGGVRAAALAYGVLEVLARTRFEAGDGPHRLLDNVTLITSVSGGSFPAAYYGQYGDRIFEDFERRFLKGHVGRQLSLRLANPINWIRLLSRSFGRSDLAAELYDDVLFHGATFGDVNARPGPLIAIQATDVIEGSRLGFSAHTFGLLCSDVATYPLASAVAASAAFPVVFSPVYLRNYAGSCDYGEPTWMREAMTEGPAAGRRFRNARYLHTYADTAARPWIPLVDGGVADNLGLHRVFDAISERKSVRELLRVRGIPDVRRLAFIVVNAQAAPSARWGIANAAPGLVATLDAVTSVQVNRYNFETLELLRRSLADFRQEWADPTAIDTYVVEVSFDQLADDAERRALAGLPTAFDLPDEEIDHLRGAAERILTGSPEFRRLLSSLGAALSVE